MRREVATLLRITRGLQDTYFKKCVVAELADMLLDEGFESRLDADPGLLGFDNGGWDLREGAFREATPDDMVSMSVGYAFHEASDNICIRDVWVGGIRPHPKPLQERHSRSCKRRALLGDTASSR